MPWCAGMWNDMGVNRNLPHVRVLPEDGANRQLANGFALEVSMQFSRRIQILPIAGGWTKVVERFLPDEVGDMENCPGRHMVLLMDFDSDKERRSGVIGRIPEHLREKVFILGAWSEPEQLRTALGSYEVIGSAMARDCREETNTVWGHPLLQHNAGELDRWRERVRPILF